MSVRFRQNFGQKTLAVSFFSDHWLILFSANIGTVCCGNASQRLKLGAHGMRPVRLWSAFE